MSSTLDIGNRLADLCRQGKNLDAIDTLYAGDVVSVEAQSGGPFPARMQGIEAVRGKNQWWLDNHEIHEGEINGPFPHGDRFIILMKYDVTPKVGPTAGQRAVFQEAGLYTVRDGKIVQEEFFYSFG